MTIFEFFLKGTIRRKNKYREEYRAMSDSERDAHLSLMEHYAIYGGPFSNKKMIEMCEAALEVDIEELDKIKTTEKGLS